MKISELWQDPRYLRCDPEVHPAFLLEARIAEFVENGEGEDDTEHCDGDTELQQRLNNTDVLPWRDGFRALEDVMASMGAPANDVEPMYWLPGWDEWLMSTEAEERLGLPGMSLWDWEDE